MSRPGENIHAYTQLLKSQKKRYGVTVIDLLFGLASLFSLIGITIGLGGLASSTGATFMFGVGALLVIFLILSFIDYAMGLGLFQGSALWFSAFLLILSVLASIVISLLSDSIFKGNSNSEILSSLVLFNFLANSLIISYFLTTATPTREGQAQMIAKLTEIRDQVIKLPLADLGGVQAVEKGQRWLQFQQRSDGIWGESNPLFETSRVLRMYITSGKGLDHSWKTIVEGKEETHTVEQTYYLVLEALDTASLEPNNDMLTPIITIAEINPQFIDLNHEVYEEFKEKLIEFSEWEMVKDIERYDEDHDITNEMPIIFPMSLIYYMKNDYEVAQKCADVFANTFGILINRSATRFTIQGETDISNKILGRMYNTIVRIIRYKPQHYKVKSGSTKKQIDSMDEFSLPTFDDAPPTEDQDLSLDLPSMDDFSMPDIEGLDTSGDLGIPSLDSFVNNSDNDGPKIRIGTSMSAIRSYLKDRQSVDGSWSGRIDITAECLEAVSDQESTENDFIKSAVNYLVSLQEKNGSWQDDIVLTADVLSVLSKINSHMDLGGFLS